MFERTGSEVFFFFIRMALRALEKKIHLMGLKRFKGTSLLGEGAVDRERYRKRDTHTHRGTECSMQTQGPCDCWP